MCCFIFHIGVAKTFALQVEERIQAAVLTLTICVLCLVAYLLWSGDPGMEDGFFWDSMTGANEHFRGATGGGDGVHVLTGPIFVEDAEPGDMLKVEILDLQPRKNPVTGKTFGSNAAAWWGFQARVKMVDGSDFKAGEFTNTPVSHVHLFVLVSYVISCIS